jgi:hypothetical protein
MSILQVVTVALPAAIGLAGLAWGVISWRKTGPQLTAELAVGQIDYSSGLLSVNFPSGDSSIMTVPKPDGKRASRPRAKPNKRRNKKFRNRIIDKPKNSFKPVNVIFAHNEGRTAVTLSRCEYLGYLGDKIGFQFEPQPDVSPFGDHLPKRLDPGQHAILIHDYKTMKAFLNEVMQDHDVDNAMFVPVLILGDGSEVAARPRFQIHVAGGPDVSDIEYEIWRQEEPMPHFVRPRPW